MIKIDNWKKTKKQIELNKNIEIKKEKELQKLISKNKLSNQETTILKKAKYKKSISFDDLYYKDIRNQILNNHKKNRNIFIFIINILIGLCGFVLFYIFMK
ncbi:MAG: hypothetical protein RBR07_04750 [Arcobacteraceae bacterium]|nr:hypothetical protein [Arcobacteraceae bacterium]